MGGLWLRLVYFYCLRSYSFFSSLILKFRVYGEVCTLKCQFCWNCSTSPFSTYLNIHSTLIIFGVSNGLILKLRQMLYHIKACLNWRTHLANCQTKHVKWKTFQDINIENFGSILFCLSVCVFLYSKFFCGITMLLPGRWWHHSYHMHRRHLLTYIIFFFNFNT